MQMQNILVATDFSDSSRAAVEHATHLARDTGARLLIVHVEVPEMIYGGDELDLVVHPLESPVARQLLEQVKPTDSTVPFEHYLLTGSPASELVRFASEQEVDLLVIGTEGRSGAIRLLLGSIVEYVVRHAPCPVLTVKATQSDPPPAGTPRTSDASPSETGSDPPQAGPSGTDGSKDRSGPPRP